MADSVGQMHSFYFRGLGGQLISMNNMGAESWYTHNGLSDVVALHNFTTGAVQSDHRFDAFGNRTGGLGQLGGLFRNPFGYRGEYFDAGTGFIYLRNRMYDPRVGRFISAVPYWNVGNMQGDILSILQAGNLYAYVLNNPVAFVDPWGLWSKAVHQRLTETTMRAFARAETNSERAEHLLYHMPHIVAGNRSVDYHPYRALNVTRDSQGRHFNIYSEGGDSRETWARHYMREAVNLWMDATHLHGMGIIDIYTRRDMRVRALELLGRGLHSIQDISAHGDFGDGMFPVPPHTVVGTINSHGNPIPGPRIAPFDNPRYDIVRVAPGVFWAVNSGSSHGSTRYAEANTATWNYLNEFYTEIGWR